MNRKKAFIVTDKVLYNLGFVKKVTDILDELKIDFKIFFDVEPDPTLATAKKGADEMKTFKPDTIIAIGGGSPMDAAKIMWVMYEHPDVRFEDLAMRFMDIRKRVYRFPKMGEKAMMVAIPTSAGTGSEVTPFAVITDEKTEVKYPLADYELTPDMAIVDAELMMDMPKGLILDFRYRCSYPCFRSNSVSYGIRIYKWFSLGSYKINLQILASGL